MKKKIICAALAVFLIMSCFSVISFAAYENTYVNTGDQREDILGVAMTQSGYMEGSLEGTVQGSDNYTKYGVWWTGATNWGVDYSHSAWCSMFVSWCAYQANIPASVLYRTAGCDEGVKKAKERGTWHYSPANGGDYTPERGDIIYFGTTSDSNHVGIVRSVTSTKVYTIEGNSSNKVNQVSYSLSSSAILGYSSPEYENSSGAAQPSKLADKLQSADRHYADVSKWQGSVDWEQASADVDGVIIRIGYRATSSRSLIIDPYFLSNYRSAKAAGLDVGCYFYSVALNDADVIEEAEWISEKLRSYGCKTELPVFLDMEDSNMQALSKSTLTGIARTFCDEMLAANFLPGIYLNKSWAVSKVDLTEVEDCAIWIAQYNTTCTYTGHYDMWQYTDKGTVSGISGDVDLNRCYVDYKSYVISNGLNGFDKTGGDTENEYPPDETYIITNHNGAQTFSDASPSSAVTGTIPYNHQIYVYETDGTFGKIVYGGEESCVSLSDAVPLKSTYTLGENLGTYRVTATSLNIRSGPSTYYQALGSLPQGTEVEITGLSGTWCRFDYNGTQAYLSSDYLEYISKTVLDSNKGTGKNTVITSPAGETITLPDCPYERQSYTFKGWSAAKDSSVSVADGASLNAEKSVRVLYAVWEKQIPENHTDGETYIVSVSSSLNVRLGPGTEYDKIGSVSDGTQLYVYETSGSWGRIIFNGEDAWISLNYASPLKDEIIFDEGCGYFQVTASSLTVRSGAGTSYSALGYLLNGETVKVLSKNGKWAEIEYNGSKGWISSNYLSKLCLIQFDSNTGTGLNTFLTAASGTNLSLAENAFVKDGYAFEGWSLTADGGVQYPDRANFTVVDDTVLYAVWKNDKVCVYSASGSQAIVNENNSTISNIPQGITAQELFDEYICADENVSLYLNAEKPCTGSLVTAQRSDGKSKDYIVVICGDIDGDGLSDARDAILAQAYLNNYLAFSDLPVGSVWASDTNKDSQIDGSDVSFMIQKGILKTEP